MKTILVSTTIIFSILTCNSAIAVSNVRDCSLEKNEILRCISNNSGTFVQTKVSKMEAIQINKLNVKISILLDKLIIMVEDNRSLTSRRSDLESLRTSFVIEKIVDDYNRNFRNRVEENQIIDAQIKKINVILEKRTAKMAEYEALIKRLQDKKNAYYK